MVFLPLCVYILLIISQIMFLSPLNLPYVNNSDTVASRGDTSLHDIVNWLKIDSEAIESYNTCVQTTSPTLSGDLLDCSNSNCKHHQLVIDIACEKLLSCLYHAGQRCLPQFSKHAKVMPVWNDSARLLCSKALFWNRVWSDNVCPSGGVLSQNRKKAKSRHKYAIRSLKCRKDHIVNKKISSALTGRHNRVFWREAKLLKRC